MKHYLLSFLSILIISSASAQKVKKDRVYFQYIQNPTTKVSQDYTYNPIITDISMEKYQNALQQYQEDLARRESVYYRKLEEYDNQVATERALYRQRLEQHRSNPRIYPMPQQPILPPKPVLIRPMVPIEPPSYDYKDLSWNLMQLDGLKADRNSSLIYQITLEGFSYLDPIIERRTTTVKKDGIEIKKTEFAYKFIYRHPISVHIFEDNGQDILTKTYRDFENNEVFVSKFFSTEEELIRRTNIPRILEDLDNQMIRRNIHIINSDINERYAYPIKNTSAKIYYAKSRKFDYPDLNKAYDLAQLGYRNLLQHPEEAKIKLKKAVDKWKLVLKNAKYHDKKARIHKKLAFGIHLNIAEALIWLDKFDQAEKYLIELRGKRISNKEVRQIEQLRSLIRNRKSRYPNRML